MNIVKAIKSDRFERKLDNGLIEVKHESTNRKYKAHYFLDENSNFQGEYKYFHSNGTLSIHCFYKDGKRHGEYKWWWSDGTLGTHCFFKDDIHSSH